MFHNKFINKIKFVEKRKKPIDSPFFQAMLIVGAVIFAFLIGAFFFLPYGIDPIKAYAMMIEDSFGNLQGLSFTAIRATPLILTGLATLIVFKSGFIYLGCEGSMYIGAIVGTWFALNCQKDGMFGPLPPWILIPVAMILAFIAAGLWASLVGICKAKFGGNEVIMSLMSNYIALLLISFLVAGPMREPGQMPQTYRIPDVAVLPKILTGTRLHLGFIIALLAIGIVYFLMYRTKVGYEMIACGDNKRAARYSGINVTKRIILAAILAGGISGAAGIIEVFGVQFRVFEGITKNMGWTGMVVSLLGRSNPLGVGIAAFLYAGMGVGADAMQRSSGIPTSVTYTIQGLIVMVLFVFDFFRMYRIVLPKRSSSFIEIKQTTTTQDERVLHEYK